MHFADLIGPEAVIASLKVKTKKQLLQELAARAARLTGLEERYIFDTLLQRERLGSTGLGLGVAIPHGRIKQLRDTVAVFVRAKDGIPFEAPDDEPVRLVYAMLVPEHATEQHLNMLSELAQMFGDADLRDALLAESDPVAVHKMLTEWTPYAAAKRTAAV